MKVPMRVRRTSLLLAVAVMACHHGPPVPVNPNAEVAVTVDNQNFADMNVYLVHNGQRVRLGMVPGLSTSILMVRPELIGLSSEVQFVVHPIGGRGNDYSERMTVHPGDVIQVTIPPH
jgi:hypothetical protein